MVVDRIRMTMATLQHTSNWTCNIPHHNPRAWQSITITRLAAKDSVSVVVFKMPTRDNNKCQAVTLTTVPQPALKVTTAPQPVLTPTQKILYPM